MRLIRIKLRGVPFWNLPPVQLSEKKPISPFIDIDKLTEEQKKIINLGVKAGEVFIYDYNGQKLQSGLELVNLVMNEVSTADTEEEIDLMPQLASVTIKEDEEEIEEVEDKDYTEEVEILLKRNGNTLKKVISSLSDVNLLIAAEKAEKESLNRTSVIKALDLRIKELNGN